MRKVNRHPDRHRAVKRTEINHMNNKEHINILNMSIYYCILINGDYDILKLSTIKDAINEYQL